MYAVGYIRLNRSSDGVGFDKENTAYTLVAICLPYIYG